MVISDGAAGLIAAAETALPRSLRQRCLIHRCRNVLAKVPAEAQAEIRDAYWALFDTDELIAAGAAPGPGLVAAVQGRIDLSAAERRRVGNAVLTFWMCPLTAIRRSSDTADVTVGDYAKARDSVRPSLDPAQIESPRAFVTNAEIS